MKLTNENHKFYHRIINIINNIYYTGFSIILILLYLRVTSL